jgi:hypothetical protein
MRWFHRAALVLIGTIVTMTIVVALLVNLDPQRYKSYVEERITEALGRNFSINGRIDFSVGSDIRLLLEDIRIAGTDWDDVDDLVSVAQLEITLRTWSLISGPLSIEQLRLAGVQVNLQSAEDGRRNWVLFPDVEPASAEQPSQPASLPVIVRQAEIRNFNVNYVDSSLQQPLRVEIEIANEQIIESRQLQLDLTGTINETPAGLTFSASSTHDLVDLADFVVSLQGNLGQVELAGTGTIDDFLAPRQPGGSLEIRGPNVQYLSDLLGMNSVMTGPLELSATLAPGTGDEVVFALDGVFGEFVIEANGSFVDLQSLDQFKVDAQASGPDARAIGNLFGYDSLPKDPFSIVAAARVAGSNIAIEDIALKIGESQFNVTGQFNDFPRPDGASLSLHAGGPDFGEFNRLLGLPGKLTGPFALDATIAAKPSQRAALSLTARNKDIAFAIDGNLVDDPQLIGSTVKLHCNGDNFAIVAAALGLTPTPQVGFDMRVSVERTGRGFKLTGGVVVLGNDRLEIDGLVGNVPLQHETDIKFSANAPDIGATLKGFGVNADGLPSGDFNASGRVFRDDGVFVLDNIAASIGLENEYILTGEGRVSDPPDFVHSNGRIALRAMNLRPFAALAGIAEIPDSPFVGSVDAERLATGISFKQAQFQLGADTLTFSGFVGERPFESNTDVQFQLQSDNLRLLLHDFGLAADSIPAEAFTGAGKLKVRDGIIEIRDTSLTLAGGELTAVGKLGTPSNFNGTNIDLILHGENLARLLPGIVAYDLASEPYSIRSNIRLVQSVLTIKGLDASVGQASLSGSASVKLDPLLEEGHFSVSAKAPRFDQLVPRYSEYVLTSQVPVTLESKGRWNKSTFHFDKYRLTIGKGHMIVDGMLDRPPGFATRGRGRRGTPPAGPP